MGVPTSQAINNTPGFTSGNIMLDRTLMQSWLPVLTYLIPLTSGVLNAELIAVQTQIETLLNITPSPSIDPLKVICPISLIISAMFSLANYQNLFGPFALPSFQKMVNNLDSVYVQYSRAFFTTRPGMQIVY
jgi:hypothetical protein